MHRAGIWSRIMKDKQQKEIELIPFFICGNSTYIDSTDAALQVAAKAPSRGVVSTLKPIGVGKWDDVIDSVLICIHPDTISFPQLD